MRLLHLSICAVFTASLGVVQAAQGSSPEAVVKDVVARDGNAQLISKLPIHPDRYMRETFTAAFNASWANAMRHNKDEPVFDADLVTGRQTVTRVTLKSSAKSENGDFAFVSTDIAYLDDEGLKKPHSMVVRFFMKREAGSWKIDDINAGDQASIRTYFKTSYGL